jgi:hypothetical protein
MNFNIDVVAADMLSAMKGVFSSNWSKVESIAKQFVQGRKEKLILLTKLHTNGEITQKEFDQFLADEKIITKMELNAMTVVSKALAQKAINAAFDVLGNAIKTAFKVI